VTRHVKKATKKHPEKPLFSNTFGGGARTQPVGFLGFLGGAVEVAAVQQRSGALQTLLGGVLVHFRG
jgi:hypothetical protein